MAYNPNNPNGQAVMASSQPVVIASDQSAVSVSQPDLLITGQGTQTVIGNNIILASAGSGSTDASGYRSGSIQVVSTGTAGTFIFENSNDNTNFSTMTVYNSAVITGTPIVAAITATSSQIIYTFPIRARYIRVRIATTITGGSLQAFTRISQESWSPAVMQVAQTTAANLATTATIASGTVTTVSTVSSVTNGNNAFPGIIADVASAALTTTTTTAAFTPTFGAAYSVNIPVTVVSGTTPTLDVQIQESCDSGTNWFGVYDFPRITATGSYNSPPISLMGNRVRYVQTVSGTTPSFTRAVNRLQSSNSNSNIIRQQYDRTVLPNTLNSNTSVLYSEGASNSVAAIEVNLAAGGTPPTFQLQGSNDGTNWVSIGSSLAGSAGASVFALTTGQPWKFMRATVSVAGVGSTLGYVFIKAY